jgi:hypothetical protein
MTDLPNEKQVLSAEEQPTAKAADCTADKAAAERRARIKKMRGWLSPRDSVADDFTAEDEALYYGSGHSGWNR